MTWTPASVAARVQHTNVRPDATVEHVERLLEECVEHRFNGAMVNPIWVPLAAERLAGTHVRVCTALDFPIGGHTVETVRRAVGEAVGEGADEIDVMTKVGWLKSGLEADYRDHLDAVVKAAAGVPVKAMLEAALLTEEELARAIEICALVGVSYLKNSSGFDGGRATPGIVTALVGMSAGRIPVKASGGIRTFDQAVALLDAGAELLGSSASVAIVTGSTPPSDGAY